MKKKYKKVLAILWHWDPLKEKKLPFDTINIEEDEESLICRIQHGRALEAMEADMVRCTEKVRHNGKFLIMIHRESLDAETHQELKNNIERAMPPGAYFDWKVFGGGSDYIYYDCKQDSGLLNQEGDFVIDDSYEYYSDDGEIVERLACVVVHNNEDMNLVKKNYFEQVWRYYHHEFKRKIYELERDLFLYFAPFTDPEYGKKDSILATHLKTNELLALRIQSFAGVNIDEQKANRHQALLFDHCSENLKAAYGQQALDVYESLRLNIDGIFLSNNPGEAPPHIAIPQIREQFAQLRSFMPERISY